MDINSAVWLYSDKPLRVEMLGGLPVYCTKAGDRPYERFFLFDTYDLKLNKHGITLAHKKTDAHKRLYLYDVFERHTVALPEKYVHPLTADVLRESAAKRILYETISGRPLLAAQAVALSVKTFSIIHTDSGEAVKVTEKRSANSKSGYYYEITPAGAPLIDIIAPVLVDAGFIYTLPAKYLRSFLEENPAVKKYSEPVHFQEGGIPATNAVLKSLTARAAAMLELTFTYDDTESVHDLRVALRSLSALLFTKPLIYEQENTAACKKIFKTLRRLTSPVRDSDVFLERLDTPENKVNSRELRKRIAQKRAMQLAELKTYCESRNLPAALIEYGGFESFDEDEAEPLFATRMKNMLSALKKLSKKNSGKLSAKRAHRIRITVKNLRYHIELLPSSCFEKDSHEVAEMLKKIQSVLGRLNDRAVQKKILKEFDVKDCKNSDLAGLITEKPDKKEIKAVRKHIKDLIYRLS